MSEIKTYEENRLKIEVKYTESEILMDFTHFEYMNSSTVTPIVKQLERAKKENRKVTIHYKKGLKWQELSFAALRVFNIPGLIEVVGI